MTTKEKPATHDERGIPLLPSDLTKAPIGTLKQWCYRVLPRDLDDRTHIQFEPSVQRNIFVDPNVQGKVFLEIRRRAIASEDMDLLRWLHGMIHEHNRTFQAIQLQGPGKTVPHLFIPTEARA